MVYFILWLEVCLTVFSSSLGLVGSRFWVLCVLKFAPRKFSFWTAFYGSVWRLLLWNVDLVEVPGAFLGFGKRQSSDRGASGNEAWRTCEKPVWPSGWEPWCASIIARFRSHAPAHGTAAVGVNTGVGRSAFMDGNWISETTNRQQSFSGLLKTCLMKSKRVKKK